MNDDLPRAPLDVDGLLEEARRIRKAVDDENERRRGQDIRRNLAIGLALLVAVVAVVVAVFAAAALTAYKADTARARVFSCNKSRSDTITLIHSEIRQSHDLIGALLDAFGRDAATDPGAIAYNARHDALIRSSHTVRVCTPDAIAAYLGQTRP